MIARGFKSVIWTMTVGSAALACYMVSLQVATERADLASVERQIIAAKSEIRTLQTELGTRGRLSQLEHWNAEVLALSAPSAAQFLQDEVKLARFEQAAPTLEERSAEVRMASAETAPAKPAAPAAPAAPVVQAVGPAPAASSAPVVRRASFTAEAPRPKPAAAPAREPAKPPVQQAKAEPKAPSKAQSEAKAPAKAASAKAAAKAPAEKPRASKIDGKLAAEIKSATGSGGN